MHKATALDWAGDPHSRSNTSFSPLHGEKNYQQTAGALSKKYNDIVGDNPINLEATSLAFNAYALSHEAKYKSWLLDYVDAWVNRTQLNGGIIPTNVGLDGAIGGGADGKWYGGVYGWGFTVRNPATGQMSNRNQHHLALTGFGNAYLLTGDGKYLDIWRTMIETVNAQGRRINRQMMYPTMYGDKGWYGFTPAKYSHGALELWYWSMNPGDRERLADNGWLRFLDGKNPNYPEQALAADFLAIRSHIAGLRADRTTPATRLADDPMAYNPATVPTLVNLMLGGLYPGHVGAPLHCRVRYFDPEKRRAGLPEDVAALVDQLSDKETGLTLVNVSPLENRTVVVQAGAYGEHRFMDVTMNGKSTRINGSTLTVELAPSSGARLVLSTKRYANAPTMSFPWTTDTVGTPSGSRKPVEGKISCGPTGLSGRLDAGLPALGGFSRCADRVRLVNHAAGIEQGRRCRQRIQHGGPAACGDGFFKRKSLEILLAEMAGEHRLRRVLGPVSLTALGVGAIIGAGIFAITGRVAAEDAGHLGITVLSSSWCRDSVMRFARGSATCRVRRDGGPVAGSAYTYTYATLGEVWAWIIGWDLILEYAMSCSVVASHWASYFDQFWNLTCEMLHIRGLGDSTRVSFGSLHP